MYKFLASILTLALLALPAQAQFCANSASFGTFGDGFAPSFGFQSSFVPSYVPNAVFSPGFNQFGHHGFPSAALVVGGNRFFAPSFAFANHAGFAQRVFVPRHVFVQRNAFGFQRGFGVGINVGRVGVFVGRR